MVDRPHESTPSQSLTAPLVRLRRHEWLHGLVPVTLRIARRPVTATNDVQLFAFVILPVVVAGLGWLLAGLTVRAARYERA